MKSRYVVIAVLLIGGQPLTACTPEIVGGAYESTALELLVSDEQRDGRSGPEALFEGVLLVSEDECLQGHARDGTIYNIEFPAGPHMNDVGEVDIGFDTIPLGEDISLGGGYSERSELTESLPKACREDVTFMVYSS
ncbi:hypothetical protein [Arthrobacter sp. Ld5]|uniref:hypothetical protein n=1 Tax=Arthrobacter sp. Ld5 TaxID=649152 RepID=UPI003EBBBD48